MADTPTLTKGPKAEECLRMHFLSSGAFVARGVKLLQGSEEVTDVDVWAYFRSSEFARSVVVVDVKNKKRAKAFERVLWAKGAQSAVRADVAVIATTENRDDLAPFAASMSIQVIGGAALQRLLKETAGLPNGRIAQEAFEAEVDGEASGKRQSLPSYRLEQATARLASGIDFSALNHWVDDAVAALRWLVDARAPSRAAVRCTYYLSALVALGGDHLACGAPFETNEDRKRRILAGLQYGAGGKEARDKMVQFAEAAAKEFVDPSGAASAKIRKGLEKELEALPVSALAEFIAKSASSGDLFKAARELEAQAFAAEPPSPSELKPEIKLVLGVLADIGSINRQRLFSIKVPSSSAEGSAAQDQTSDLFQAGGN
jgi:hypothetical protein